MGLYSVQCNLKTSVHNCGVVILVAKCFENCAKSQTGHFLGKMILLHKIFILHENKDDCSMQLILVWMDFLWYILYKIQNQFSGRSEQYISIVQCPILITSMFYTSIYISIDEQHGHHASLISQNLIMIMFEASSLSLCNNTIK